MILISDQETLVCIKKVHCGGTFYLAARRTVAAQCNAVRRRAARRGVPLKAYHD